MAEFHASVTINRPRDEVFRYLVDPGTQTVWNSGLQEFTAAAPFPFTLKFTLTERDGATEVQHDGSTEAMSGFFGKLADPLVALMYQRDMNSNLSNLKSILEES